MARTIKKKVFKFQELGIGAQDTAILLCIADKYGKKETDLMTDDELDSIYEDIKTLLESTNHEFTHDGRRF